MKSKVILSIAILLIAACSLPEHYYTPQPTCQKQADWQDETLSSSPAYQAKAIELIRAMKANEFRYFFETFIEEGNHTYMLTNFRNDSICVDVKLLIEKWDKLAGMKRVNGKAYPKELYDLEWGIEMRENKEEVVYRDMHDIID